MRVELRKYNPSLLGINEMEGRYYHHILLELLGNLETTRPVLSILRTLKPDSFLGIREFLIVVGTTQAFQLQVLCVFYYIKLFSYRT